MPGGAYVRVNVRGSCRLSKMAQRALERFASFFGCVFFVKGLGH